MVKWIHGKRGVWMQALNQLKGWIERLTSRYTLILSLIIFGFFIAHVLPREMARTAFYTEGLGTPDTKGFYTPTELFDMADHYGDVGRMDYVRSRLTFDVVWPLVYLFFFLVWSTVATSKKYRIFNTLPLLAFMADLLENSFVSIVMVQFPLRSTFVAILALTFSLVKWIAVFGCLLILFVGGVNRLKNGFHKPINMV